MIEICKCSVCLGTFGWTAGSNKVLGGEPACDYCFQVWAPQVGERVTVLSEDSPEFGRSYPVDSIVQGRLVLRVGDTYKSFAFGDVAHPLHRMRMGSNYVQG